MYQIKTHPILEVPAEDLVEFEFEGRKVKGQKGQTIAAPCTRQDSLFTITV